MPGSIAKNAQEGTRSEYLAQYALSSFGTAIPVPHPEDSGIDLYCTLGKKIGRRFLVENPYLVQVKSKLKPIVYEGPDEVEWLLSHNYPFIICVVSKNKARLELFQTVALATLVAKKNISKITLHPCEKKGVEYFPSEVEGQSIDIYLGSPIVRFSIINFSDGAFKKKLSETIKSWIELDQENINLRETGYTLYRIPESWKSNQKVEALKFIGNFKDCFETDKVKQKFDDLFFKMLSQLINQAAANKNKNEYMKIIDFILFYTGNIPHNDNFGVRILQFCINEGNKHLGLKERLSIFAKKT